MFEIQSSLYPKAQNQIAAEFAVASTVEDYLKFFRFWETENVIPTIIQKHLKLQLDMQADSPLMEAIRIYAPIHLGLLLAPLDLRYEYILHQDIKGHVFDGINVNGILFQHCNLGAVTMNKCHCDLDWGRSAAEFKACDVKDMRIRSFKGPIHMDRCKGKHVGITDSDISHSLFVGNEMVDLSFSRCNLTGSVFDRCELTRATFEGCDLSKVKFIMCDLMDCSFTKEQLEQASFNRCAMPADLPTLY